MNALFEFEYRFDVAFVRRALRRDFLDKALFVTAILLALGVVLQLVNRAFSWTITLTVQVGILFVWLRLRVLLTTVSKRVYELWTKQSPEGVVRFRLDDEGFDVDVGSSHSRYAWQGLRRLWRYPDVWMIEIVKNQSVFFPPEAASAAARELVFERCREAGVRT